MGMLSADGDAEVDRNPMATAQLCKKQAVIDMMRSEMIQLYARMKLP